MASLVGRTTDNAKRLDSKILHSVNPISCHTHQKYSIGLRISSYNCRGLPKDSKKLLLRPDICEVLEKSHIVALQETWFAKQHLKVLNSIHKDFVGVGAATVDESINVYYGHYPGGVALLWRKELGKHIKRLEFNVNWGVAFEIDLGTIKFVILNIYMPYQCTQNRERYFENLCNINTFIESLQTTNFMIVGDWNANLMDGSNSLFGPTMSDFCKENNLFISTKLLLPSDTYTYVSTRNDNISKTWIDHVVSSNDLHNAIDHVDILYDVTGEDHIPLIIHLNVDNIPKITNETNDLVPKINWHNVKDLELRKYYLSTCELLDGIELPTAALSCKNLACKNVNHVNDLKIFYNNVIAGILKSGKHLGGNRTDNYKIRPGWTEYVSDLYDYSKQCRRIWLEKEEPEDGDEHDEYVRSRAQFKYALRSISRNEDKLRKESMAKKLSEKKVTEFWKEVSMANNCKTPLPDDIDGTCGSDEIVKLWKKHFQDIFNCLNAQNVSPASYVLDEPINNITVNANMVKDAIKELGLNKSSGSDGITAEHLRHASEKLPHVLAMCITGFLTHGFLPDSMLSVIIVPVIKDKAGNINAKDNYRPIALASIISKIVEMIMFDRMESYLLTQPNQFGFKKKHGTDQCIFVLKELINKYRSRGSCVYTCFLDASKAFDRVNHSKLFKKLSERGVPGYLLRILIYWYANQTMCVRWGSKMSDKFHTSNGVRQGSILSPHFFKVYVDDLSISLNTYKIGCAISDLIINHIMYADDLVLISPSSAGLKILLDVCHRFGLQNDIKFNSKKSAILPFLPENKKKLRIPTFELNKESIPITDSFRYLGHILSCDGSDDLDIQRQRKKVYAQGNSILRKFHMCSVEVKVLLFKTFCTPLYTAHLWTNYSNASINCFYTAYHNIMKLFIGLPKREHNRPLCVEHDIPHGPALLRNLIYRFICRLKESQNELLSIVNSSDCVYDSPLRKKWKSLLYT